MEFSRVWAMPNADTFSVKPIGEFVNKHVGKFRVSVDPFARNNTWPYYSNDIDPNTAATYHMDAEAFLHFLKDQNTVADIVILDPPYSPRQISECYKRNGFPVTMTDTQSGALYKRVRDAADKLLQRGGIVLSFGWNTVGMGKSRGYEIIEIMLCCHGGAHNDTICMAERKL